MEKIIGELKLLFEEARQRSEFEFVLTLINYRGMGKEDVTNLYEWFDSIEFYKKLYSQLDGKEKTRIGSLLYSTFFENSDFYNIIGSLCKISLGFKGSSYLYHKTRKLDRLLGTGEKIELILELLNDCNKQELIRFFNDNHLKEIRNTFFHSAYSLLDNDYILHDTEPIFIDGVGHRGFDVTTFLYPKIDSIIAFFDAFKQFYYDSFNSFKENKIVDGFFPNPIKATIIGSPNGLRGFVIPKSVQFYGEWHDSGIMYNEEYDMWVGQNIRITSPQKETIEIDDQLKRYEAKDDITRNNSEFNNLIDSIVERKRPDEIARATQLLAKFGTVRFNKMEAEQNPHKKKSFPKIILPYYQKAVDIGSQIF